LWLGEFQKRIDRLIEDLHEKESDDAWFLIDRHKDKILHIVEEAKKDVEKVISEFPNISAWNNPETAYKIYVAELEDWFENKLKPTVDRWFS